MPEIQIIDLTIKNFAEYGVCGYKDVKKHKELKNKIDWFSEYYSKGLRIKVVISETGGYQGMIEYIPGVYAHRPVIAAGYMFVHCIFVGFNKEFKGKGFASMLLDACIKEARQQKMKGVAVVVRKGSFMADKRIFIKNGFELVDKAKPDFELLVNKFETDAMNPGFNHKVLDGLGFYSDGFYIFRSVQCPYTEKNLAAIIKTAKEKYHLDTSLIDIKSAEGAQRTPSPFGAFCIIYNGKVISYHPISNTRFENIMKKEYV